MLSLLPAYHGAQACLLPAPPTCLTTQAQLLLTALQQQRQPQQMLKLRQMTTWALRR
jgi:hypothetical protein